MESTNRTRTGEFCYVVVDCSRYVRTHARAHIYIFVYVYIYMHTQTQVYKWNEDEISNAQETRTLAFLSSFNTAS